MPENKMRMKTVINVLGNGRLISPERYSAAVPADTIVYCQICVEVEVLWLLHLIS